MLFLIIGQGVAGGPHITDLRGSEPPPPNQPRITDHPPHNPPPPPAPQNDPQFSGPPILTCGQS